MAVTIPQVKLVIDSGEDDAFITLCITAAGVLVNRVAIALALTGKDPMSVTESDTLTLWLSAHFVAVKVPQGRLTAYQAAGVKETYGLRLGLGLDGSPFGQMAKALDPTGTLKALDSKALPGRLQLLLPDGMPITGAKL